VFYKLHAAGVMRSGVGFEMAGAVVPEDVVFAALVQLWQAEKFVVGMFHWGNSNVLRSCA